ncbi:MAG TPA: thermosome subunit alpha [archaeon]|nr:thermosome subunit alpha [archaeon]
MANNSEQNAPFLPEGSKREKGRDAQRLNILVAKAVANAVKSTLGPKGMDKMLVDELGDVTISNDGATILKEMAIEHPVGKMLVELAKTQDTEIGDGTTTAVVLAGELVGKAEALLDENIHPSIIIKGYKLAAEKALDYFKDISLPLTIKDKELLLDIARTSMTGKAYDFNAQLANIVVDAVLKAYSINKELDREDIKLEKKLGASILDTQLINGIVLDKEIIHSEMPKLVKDAKIAILSSALEIKEPETDAKIQISSPEQLMSFVDQEEALLKKMVDAIKATGANVVLCQKGIDDLAAHYLAKAKILAVRRLKESDISLLAKATGAKIVNRIKDISKDDLGSAKQVYEKKVAGDSMLFIEGTKEPGAVTILLRGGSEQSLAEIERTINDAVCAVISSLKIGRYVAAGGSSEVEVALKLRDFARTIGGREQLAIETFADVLDVIPKTLAESAGLDAIDTIVTLRSKHQSPENKFVGIDVINSKITDMKKLNVIEPLNIKTQAIVSSIEVVEMILRIDDIIAASSKNKGYGGMPPGGMPPMDM